MKWYSYIICVVLIVLGVFCGCNFYREVTAKSYINGSINITNQFTQESFKYCADGLFFDLDSYADTPETYVFEANLKPTENFDASKKDYQVKLNKFNLIEAEINPGSVYADVDFDFHGSDGELVQGTKMKMSILFLSDKTQLRFVVIGQESRAFVEKYFSDNGIRLFVNEIL